MGIVEKRFLRDMFLDEKEGWSFGKLVLRNEELIIVDGPEKSELMLSLSLGTMVVFTLEFKGKKAIMDGFYILGIRNGDAMIHETFLIQGRIVQERDHIFVFNGEYNCSARTGWIKIID